MQLGDCGQEVALISRLVEGSRVFLSRDESQHFIKESVYTDNHTLTFNSIVSWSLYVDFTVLVTPKD